VTHVGQLAQLWRYPVKSLLGERCAEAPVGLRGVAGDRLYAVRDAQGKLGSGKNTRRFTRIDGLFGLSAFYEGDVPCIRLPSGELQRADAPGVHAALSAQLGQPVTLAHEDTVSHFDDAPVHLLTTASLRWLQAQLPDSDIDVRRFRPNLLLDIPGCALREPSWIGRCLRIGDALELELIDATERCVMVTLAQAELPEDAAVLRALAEQAQRRLGVYARVRVPGVAREGDSVKLLD